MTVYKCNQVSVDRPPQMICNRCNDVINPDLVDIHIIVCHVLENFINAVVNQYPAFFSTCPYQWQLEIHHFDIAKRTASKITVIKDADGINFWCPKCEPACVMVYPMDNPSIAIWYINRHIYCHDAV